MSRGDRCVRAILRDLEGYCRRRDTRIFHARFNVFSPRVKIHFMDDPRTIALNMLSSRTREFEERREKEIKTILADHNKRGVLQSGARHKAVYRVNKKYLLELPLKTKLEIERELIQKRLQEPNQQLKKVLEQDFRTYVREFARKRLLRETEHDLSIGKSGDNVREYFHQTIEDDCENTRAAYFNEIAILLPLSQAEARMKEEPVSMNITYNITGMANFGQVIGDINVNVQQIKQRGHEEIAEALKELTEAIVNDVSLKDDDKTQAIGQMQELSKQARVEKESRNKGVIEAIFTHLPTLMTLSEKCQELWGKYEPIIRGFLE